MTAVINYTKRRKLSNNLKILKKIKKFIKKFEKTVDKSFKVCYDYNATTVKEQK